MGNLQAGNVAGAAAGKVAGSVIGDVLTPAGVLESQRLSWDGTGRIVSIEPEATASPRPLLLPGLADVHNHGGAGHSFPTSDLEGCRAAAQHHRAHGTTTLLTSTVSAPAEVLLPRLELLAQLAQEGLSAGIHAEGPFIAAVRCGAQDPSAIVDGDPGLFREMIAAAGGHLRAVTFAPETAHARELVDLCAANDVVVSLGHTDADAQATTAIIDYAVAAGARVSATHLCNAMPPLHHRAPGPVAALLRAAMAGRATVELVADGVHLDDELVAFVADAAGPDAVSFVSDAMGAAGQADGAYMLGALEVVVAQGVARLRTADGSPGAIAGGTSRVIDQVRRQVRAGWDLGAAVRAATSGHRLLGLRDRGELRVGARADVVATDSNLYPLRTWVGGVDCTPPDLQAGDPERRGS